MRRRRSAAIAAALVLCLMVFIAAPALAGERGPASVSVRAGYHNEFARIAFTWPAPVEFTTKIEGSVLVIAFERPLKAALNAIPKRLHRHVKGATLDADGRTIRIELTKPVELRRLSYGKVVVVDLFDSKGSPTAANGSERMPVARASVAPAPPTSPAMRREADVLARVAPAAAPPIAEATETGPAPAAAQPASNRAAMPFMAIVSREHSGFSRVIFDWDRPVSYTIERDGNTIAVHFASAGIVEPLANGKSLPRHIKAVETTSDDTSTVVHIRAANAESVLRHFQRGHRVVVDLMDAASKDAKQRPEWATQDAVPIAALETNAKPTEDDKAPPQSADPAPSVVLSSLASLDRPRQEQATAPEPAQDAASTEPSSPAGASTASTSNTQILVPAGPVPPVAMAAPHDSEPAIKVTPPNQATRASELSVRAEAGEAGVRLRFPFEKATASAVFARMGYLWIVFDAPVALDLSQLGADGPLAESFVGLEQLEHETATVLRLTLAPQIRARAVRVNTHWLVELGNRSAKNPRAVLAQAEPATSGSARVMLPLVGVGKTITLKDPEVGDTLIVVPSSEPGVSIKEARSFVQFALLQTVQGAVIVPNGDAIEVALAGSGVEITGRDDLLLSPDVARDPADHARNRLSDATSTYSSFDFKAWRHADLGSFNQALHKLQVAAADSDAATRTDRRLDLARFLFAHGLATDALGVLDRVLAEDDTAAQQSRVIALRGAARLFLGRFDEAAPDLNHPSLDEDSDVALWRAALAASRGDHELADSTFSAAAVALESLPDDLRRRFGLLAAQSAIAVKNYRRANHLLDQLGDGEMPGGELAEIDYLKAQVLDRTEKTEAALAAYEKLTALPGGPVKARAALAAVELKLAHGALPPDDAIATLERLRTSWRGDTFEQQLLRRLGELYVEKHDYMNALGALRDAVERFPDSASTEALRGRMYGLMNELFVAGDADALTPLEALGLYYEFEDSAPAGAAGSHIVEGLANKLIAIDLLDRAAILLKKHMKRVEGEDRARLGTRLAAITLADGKPDTALATLKETNTKDLPAELGHERARIAASAHAAAGQLDKALAQIKDDDSVEAERLRVDLHWDAKAWLEVAAAVERLFPAASTDLAALSADDHGRIMRGAVARAMSNDAAGLETMRARFGEAMKATGYAGAFDFITSPSDHAGVDPRELPKLIANIDGAEALKSMGSTAAKAPETKTE